MAFDALPCGGTAQPFRCPTKWELWAQTLLLGRRGRAWQTHEDVSAWTGAEPDVTKLTVMEQYWAAFAEVLENLHQRACALLDEMFCERVSEMRADWEHEFGFPDACEAYYDLCEKMRARGGATCAYLVEMAARRGWAIECVDCDSYETSVAGWATAGCSATLCSCEPGDLFIRILTADSPAFTEPERYPVAGHAVAGCFDICDPTPTDLICLLERIRPAHVRVYYYVV